MRVLHVLEAVGTGAGMHVATLAREMQRRGDDVLVACPSRRAWGVSEPGFVDGLRSQGTDVHELGMHSLPSHPRNVRAGMELDRLIRRWAPDVVHSHSTTAGSVARPVARRCGVPAIHTPHAVRFADPHRSLMTTAALLLERVLAPLTTRVIAVSGGEADVLARAYPRARIAVVPNGVAVPTNSSYPPSAPRIVSVHRFVQQKAPEAGVRIMAMVRERRPETEAVIVGSGPLEKEVRSLVARLDPGILLEATTPGVDALRSSSLLLQTSRYEGASYVTLEAMSLGRPVIATNVVGTRDIVKDGVTGYLFDIDRLGDAVDLITRLVDDDELAARMGEEARRHVRASYSIDRMVDETRAVYAAALTR